MGNHSLMILEESNNVHNSRENSDGQKLVENAIFEKEKGKSYPECHINITFSENNTGNHRSENTKENANSKLDKANTNFGKQIANSQRFGENAKITEENISMHDCRQSSKSEEDNKYLNVNANAPLQNVEENADMQNVRGKANLQNVEESSDLQKVTVDLYSRNVKGVPTVHVKELSKALIQRVNDTYVTHLDQQTRKNEDNSVPMEEKSSYYAEASLVVDDVSTLEINELKDTSRTFFCARTDLRENKSLYKDALTPVSRGIRGIKEAKCNLNKRTIDTKQNCNDIGEMYQGIMQDKKTFLTDENIQVLINNGSAVTEQHCIDTGKMYHAINQDKKTFLIDENVQDDMDDGTIETVHLGNMQRDIFYEKTTTMIVGDTNRIDTALSVETTEGNVSEKSTSLTIVRDIDKKTELNNYYREMLSAFGNLEHSFPCPFTVEEITDLSMTFSRKMCTFQASNIFHINTSGEKAVQEEIICTSKDCIKVICMVLILTDTIEQDILLTNKKYIEMKDNSSIVLNEGQKVSRQSTVSDYEGFVENNIEMGSKSCRPEKVQQDMSMIRPNKQMALYGNDAQFTTLNTKENYGTLHVSGSYEEIKSTQIETIFEKFSWIKNDIKVQEKSSFISHGAEKTSVGRKIAEDGGFSSESLAMKRCSSKKKGQVESSSLNKPIGQRANEGRDEQKVSLKMVEENLHANEEILPLENIQGDLRWTNDDLKVKQTLLVFLLEAEQVSIILENKVPTEKREEQENFEEVPLVRFESMSHQGLHRIAGYSDTTCKSSRKLQPQIAPCNYRYLSCITGECIFPKNQTKNLFVKVKKPSQFFKKKIILISSIFTKPQRNSEIVKFAIRKQTVRQSHCTLEDQCSSFYKSFVEGFGIKQRLHIPLKTENVVSRIMSRISSNESTEQSKENECIIQSCYSLNHKNVSEVGDKGDTDENSSFESSHTILEQNLRPEIDQVAWKTAKESNDSDFGSIESFGLDFILKMKTVEHAFQDNKVKLSSKQTKKLMRKLREKDGKLRKDLSAGYINTILYPFYFRPELFSAIVYPVYPRHQRLQGGLLSHEESFSYEWLRLESLRNYDGAGSVIRLAQGGFYHDPVDGPLSTRCYACNFLYSDWEYFDNVTEVHQQSSPNCPHLRENASVSGNVSIENGSLDTLPNRTGSSATVNSPQDRAIEHDSQSAAAVSNTTDPLMGTQIGNMLAEESKRNAEQQAQGTQDIESLKDENSKLRERLTCKICLDRPIAVTLLPCGHFVCCVFCSLKISVCPICRSIIGCRIRTFMC